MTDRDKSITEAERFRTWADGFLNFEKTPQKNIFWLDTMEYLCGRLGNPQEACKSFHVAGSKGKGSVSEMISSILREANFSTGLYTSPHIIDFAERISSPDGYFPSYVYKNAAEFIFKRIGEIKTNELPGQRAITWFELVTLYGMQCFKEADCQWAVYEVGLGGRLDATNVIAPECCCINRIEKEHTEYLGDTLEKIAAEKGGIIKKGTPVVIGRQSSESVNEIFKSTAKSKDAEIIFVQEEAEITNLVYKNTTNKKKEWYEAMDGVHKNRQPDEISMDFTLSSRYFSRPLNISLQMLGEFQADNAAVAAIAVKKVLPNLDESIIERGLSNAKLPGRFEILQHVEGLDNMGPLVLDGAHTQSSIKFSIDTFFKLYDGKAKPNLLFACASDKDVEDISKLFSGRFSNIVLTIPGNTKGSDLPRAEKAFRQAGVDFTSTTDYVEAIKKSLIQSDRDRVPLMVIGSFYLVAEVKKVLREVMVTSKNPF